MIYKKLSLSVLLFAAGFLTASAQKSPQDMDRFIDVLMNKMTLEEKIGQLNLPVTGEITTGQAKSSDIAAKIKKGEVGGLFNLKGVEKIREVQKQAGYSVIVRDGRYSRVRNDVPYPARFVLHLGHDSH